MKLNQSITAALIALGIISSASAANVIYITGSTAFRSSMYNAISTGASAGGVFDTTPDVCGYANSNKSKSSWVLAHGNIGGVETYISAAWSGSEAGIANVAGITSQTINDGAPLAGVPQVFLKPDITVNPANSGSPALPNSTQLEATAHAADLTMADTSQAVSLTSPTANGGANKLTDYGIIGIVPFTWYKGVVNSQDAAWSRLTNLQSYQAAALLGGGHVTADLLNSGAVGGINDYDHNVYLIGRNKGSGTRVNQLLAAGYPVNTPVSQYAVASTVGVNPSTGQYGLYYVGGAYSLTAVNDNGYESGGDVAKALNLAAQGYTDANSAPILTVGFMSTSDAGTVSGPVTGAFTGAMTNWLTYNGVMESDGAIENGSYLPWGHEHIMGKHTPDNTAATALVPKLFTSVKSQLVNNDTVALSDWGTVGWNDKYDPATLHSAGIYAYYMNADRGVSGSDAGFPVSGDAVGFYSKYTTAAQ